LDPQLEYFVAKLGTAGIHREAERKKETESEKDN
jgi:hypothetical protein